MGWWRERGRTDPVVMMILCQAGLDVGGLCEGSDVGDGDGDGDVIGEGDEMERDEGGEMC